MTGRLIKISGYRRDAKTKKLIKVEKYRDASHAIAAKKSKRRRYVRGTESP